MPEITGNLPQHELDLSKLSIPSGIQLADPEFFVSSKIDLLLGAGVFFEILLQNRIDCLSLNYSLHKTKFGWIIAGFLPNMLSYFAKSVYILSEIKGVNRQLERFWEIEECTAQAGDNHGNSFRKLDNLQIPRCTHRSCTQITRALPLRV